VLRDRATIEGLTSPGFARAAGLLVTLLLAALFVPTRRSEARTSARGRVCSSTSPCLLSCAAGSYRGVQTSVSLWFLVAGVDPGRRAVCETPVGLVCNERDRPSAEHIDQRATILFAKADQDDVAPTGDVTDLLIHAGNLLGLAGDRVVLTFYEGGLAYFPVIFRAEKTPFGRLFEKAAFSSSREGWRGTGSPRRTPASTTSRCGTRRDC